MAKYNQAGEGDHALDNKKLAELDDRPEGMDPADELEAVKLNLRAVRLELRAVHLELRAVAKRAKINRQFLLMVSNRWPQIVKFLERETGESANE